MLPVASLELVEMNDQQVFWVCFNILGMLKTKSIAAQLNQQASIYITELYHCISIFKKVS